MMPDLMSHNGCIRVLMLGDVQIEIIKDLSHSLVPAEAC